MANYTQHAGLKVSTPLGDDKLILRGLHGEDRLSGLFHYQLELLSEESDLDFSAIVGEPVTVTIASGDTEYKINGICSRFVQAGSGPRFTTYYAELRPWFWLTTMMVDSKIFQEKSVTDIIDEVLKAKGFSDFEIKCEGSYEPRVYCVQYNESVFNFLSRLMEDEGIYYFFTHEDGKHTMVIADSASAHEEREGQAPGRVKSQESTGDTEDIITSFAVEEQVTATAYAMTDYNFEQPTGDLAVNVQGDSADREIYEYPGGYAEKSPGETRVKVRLEEQEAAAKVVKGQSHCRGFLSGYKIKVEEHVREDLNGDYVLKWVSHIANFRNYTNTFEAIPADVPFRAPRMSRKPRIYGSQTAVVVGKSGEEIYTDEYGRIKVQFHWDRDGADDEKSSCWCRVSQYWAGKGFGAWFLPRIGQEVVVSFLEGDPDRPLVTGSVYNAEQTVPYALPDDMTKSTTKTQSSKEKADGYNEIRFEDLKDSEEIYMHAEKDMNIDIKNCHTRNVAGAETITIGWKDENGDHQGGGRTVLIKEGDETFTVEKGNRALEVTEGDETYTIGGKRTVKVSGDEDRTNEGNYDMKVSGNYTLKVDGDITIEAGGAVSVKSGTSFAVESGTDMSVKAGTSLASESGTSYEIKAGTTFSNKASVTSEIKASATMTVDGGGMLTLKGGLVQIN